MLRYSDQFNINIVIEMLHVSEMFHVFNVNYCASMNYEHVTKIHMFIIITNNYIRHSYDNMEFFTIDLEKCYVLLSK
jgi:hypothetical protein